MGQACTSTFRFGVVLRRWVVRVGSAGPSASSLGRVASGCFVRGAQQPAGAPAASTTCRARGRLKGIRPASGGLARATALWCLFSCLVEFSSFIIE